MSAPLLSICIPTYNFGAFLGETLASVLTGLPEAVEVVVFDGGSTDGTEQVVRACQQQATGLRYIRAKSRGGIDRDLVSTVMHANGDYCWLFSGDDLMRPGAVLAVLSELASAHDIYLCKHTMCTLDMRVLGERAVLRSDLTSTFRLHDPMERMRYFGLAATTEAFFSFMGGLIVRRTSWNRLALNEEFVGSCWAHVARLFELMETELTLRYIPLVLLDRRGDNDSFADRGVVNRYRIAIEGFQQLAARFFGDSSEYAWHVRRTLRTEFGLRMFLHAKQSCRRRPETESFVELLRLAALAYRDVPLQRALLTLALRATPAWLHEGMRVLYRAVRWS
jgi:abequosyltransferase